MSGAFFRLSSGCLSTRLRREQSRQQLVSCSFPRETWANTHLRETRFGAQRTCLPGWPTEGSTVGLSPPLVGDWSACLPCSLVSFFRGLVAAPVAHFAFWAIRGLLQRRVQVWAQRFHRVCSPCGVRNQRSVTPCSSSRTGGRSTVYGQRFQRFHRVQPCNFSFPVCSCLFVPQLHLLAFSAASSCFFQLSPRPHSRRRPRHQAQPKSGDF